jgi:hypothetical protein
MAGAGSGTVTATGIDCGGPGHADCSETYPGGTSVDLTATPAAGSAFSGWSGACSGAGACQPTMSSDRSVTATFVPTHTLTVTTTGSGSGRVTGNGIDCGGGHTDCSATYAEGTSVTLTATAGAESTFAGWGGACSGAASCQATMSADRNVSASFAAVPPPNTKISSAKISQAKNSATFKFKALASSKSSAGPVFLCALAKKHHKAKLKGCASPKIYRHLKPGKYTFSVRAVSAAGTDPTPATKRFKIKGS